MVCRDKEPFTPAARSALVDAYRTANHSTIAAEIGVLPHALIENLRTSADLVTGDDNHRAGDLILELDGRITSW